MHGCAPSASSVTSTSPASSSPITFASSPNLTPSIPFPTPPASPLPDPPPSASPSTSPTNPASSPSSFPTVSPIFVSPCLSDPPCLTSLNPPAAPSSPSAPHRFPSYIPSFFAYVALAITWVVVLFHRRTAVFYIHYFMLTVVILKAQNLLYKAEDKSYINRTGSAHGWDVLFYIFSFLKGIYLFTLIVLIGTGWSFLKPYLQDHEKRVLMAVIPLQEVANITQVVIDESGRYSSNWSPRSRSFSSSTLYVVAPSFPHRLVHQEPPGGRQDQREGHHEPYESHPFPPVLHRLVICKNFTRVGVYALSNFISYRYLWTSIVAGELATLSFYVFTGYKFKLTAHNPYLTNDDDEEAAAKVLKLDDDAFKL